jgi:SAM-dependent methyltransferase
MQADERPRSGELNGRLWGAGAADWAAAQEPHFQPIYEEVFRRAGLSAGATLLDAGCGAGLALRLAADLGARVSGLDASEGLLAVARGRLPGADLRCGDLEELPFADGAFDLVTGFNSFQFAARPVVAMAEARRVTRVGGQVAVVTWTEPAGMEAAALVTALTPLLPPPPPGTPGPFALSDEVSLRALATAAGLRPSVVFEVAAPWVYPDMETAVRALGSTGVAARAAALLSQQVMRDAFTAALQPFRRGDGTYSAGARFRCLLAHV